LDLSRAEKHLRLWGNPLWGRNVPGLLTWAAINAGLWVCFVWWLAGLTKLVWVIGASAYTGVILFHGIISIRPGYVHSQHSTKYQHPPVHHTCSSVDDHIAELSHNTHHPVAPALPIHLLHVQLWLLLVSGHESLWLCCGCCPRVLRRPAILLRPDMHHAVSGMR
jgi:hypothetical protein